MAKERKRVVQTRLGEREISPDSVVYFPRGLIGLSDKKEFALIPVGDNVPFYLLQCLSDPGLGLLVTDPYPFVPDYDVRIEAAEKKMLRIQRIKQLAVVVTVTIPKNEPEKITLNLSGPIVINTEARVGMQVPQTDAKRPAHFRPMVGNPES